MILGKLLDACLSTHLLWLLPILVSVIHRILRIVGPIYHHGARCADGSGKR